MAKAKASPPKQDRRVQRTQDGPLPTTMMVPRHGIGQLRVGNPGCKGGIGTPPSAIRIGLRGDYNERRAFLRRVVDGDVMQTIEMPAHVALAHAKCPACGIQGMHVKGGDMGAMLTFDVKASATVRDRIAALEQMAKYGLGTLKEVSVENVRERVEATIATIRALLPDEQAEAIVQGIRPHWT